MKKQKLLLVLPALFALQNTFAQNSLKLSDAFPRPSETVKITYDAKGTALDGKKDISASVFFIDGKDNPVADVDFKPNGALLTGEFTVPANAKAFFVKIGSGEDVDNNAEKGYIFPVYKDKKPVAGAYESEAFILTSGLGTRFGKIKMDSEKGIDLFKKEDEVNPTTEKLFGIQYYSALAKKKDAETTALLNNKVKTLEKSDKEKDLLLAAYILNWTKQSASADSLGKVIQTKFPKGESVYNETAMAIYQQKDLDKKDSLYQAYEKEFPSKLNEKNGMLDYARAELATGFLQKGDNAKFNIYAGKVQTKTNLAAAYNNSAYEWAKTGEKLDAAEKLSKQSLDIMADQVKNPQPALYTSPRAAAKNAKASYDMYADTYAFILYKEKKYDEALKYQKEVYATNTYNDPEINEHYVLILNALGKYAESKPVIESALKDGKGTEILKAELKKAYVGVKGSEAGYDEYLTSLTNFAKNKKREELTKQMINQPALPFALKDFEGNTVSLASLKGKVVIVDFWATWCGPCKASFPGMQTAVNKYKDDADVKFLFVDTWENGDNYTDGVKKFIADKKYTFYVLLDEKGADGRQSKVVSQFGVSGIPTKFIIDKSGNIRFKVVGFDGSADGLVDEVSAMIDLAKEPAIASPEKSK
ncbi:redoxin domain-containing protein [Mucilaginibacter dorajii]|uniref:Thioredoxin domain-containing protein n=1 Tax=Mucilaginibacter dorajii TaxID=692994 RepID=A0ABP7QWQ9_9SPHI|nr:redoxin domain-containing protein [Mucilaginibacter dorajii]MCS3732461.1 thiol-disulfide isomerase/thioredoxin [Mucilaginibacter dorajii]